MPVVPQTLVAWDLVNDQGLGLCLSVLSNARPLVPPRALRTIPSYPVIRRGHVNRDPPLLSFCAFFRVRALRVGSPSKGECATGWLPYRPGTLIT